MSDISIKVEDLSKLYQLGEVGTGTLSRDLERWWAGMRGKEDPFAKIGQVNNRTIKSASDFVWALKDINFEVQKGEVLGIIGRNGAGKSTLLKILSKITAPTSGKIYLQGRIASLLEVGTGFHPEMTGRENIFMNGAILGMRKREIQSKFDEIVNFSGVESYIDTPVKRYSSGMYVRLAFAVAAFLEQEILIVDEVLAVGDVEFQRKCLSKMKDITSESGRTVLFVSHNLASIRELSNRSVLLENGTIKNFGNTDFIIQEYVKENFISFSSNDKNLIYHKNDLDKSITWNSIRFLQNESEIATINNSEPLEIEIRFEIKEDLFNFRIYLEVYNETGILIFRTFNNEKHDIGEAFNRGHYILNSHIPKDIFIEGKYFFKVIATLHNVRDLNPKEGLIFEFDVFETGWLKRKRFMTADRGLLTLPIIWHKKSDYV